MSSLLNAFWRAVAYCLHPRVMALSLLPLVLLIGLSLGLGYLYWDSAVQQVDQWLVGLAVLERLLDTLASLGLGGLRQVVAPAVLLVLVTPLLVLVSLLAVAWIMTPAMVRLVAERRFPALVRAQGARWWHSVLWSIGATLLALGALVLSLPLWLVPPLVLILPPLIWGWLTYRVFAFDALAEHASADERHRLMREHRLSLLAMGVLCGYLGAAPSVIWASGAMVVALAPLLVPLAIWLYTLVLAFSSLWFTHYCLAALADLRAREPASRSENLVADSPPPPVPLPPI